MTHKRYRNPDQGYSRNREREAARQTIERDLFGKSAGPAPTGSSATETTVGKEDQAATEAALGDLDLGALVADGPTPQPRTESPNGAQPAKPVATARPRQVGADHQADLEVHKPTFAQRVLDRLLGLLKRSH